MSKVCPDCQMEIPDYAKVCPHCGYRFSTDELHEEARDHHNSVAGSIILFGLLSAGIGWLGTDYNKHNDRVIRGVEAPTENLEWFFIVGGILIVIGLLMWKRRR